MQDVVCARLDARPNLLLALPHNARELFTGATNTGKSCPAKKMRYHRVAPRAHRLEEVHDNKEYGGSRED